MILADKIIQLRKKNGWSQEDLANQLNVSRQSISKWEGAQSIPDLQRIMQMSDLFGVTTDYLLRDELEEVEYLKEEVYQEGSLRIIPMQTAHDYLGFTLINAPRISFAIALFILCPIPLLMLGAASETKVISLSDSAAGAIGCILLFLMIAAGVALILVSGLKEEEYEYLEKEEFELEYGVMGMVKERKQMYRSTYIKTLTLGICLCILAVIPIFIALVFTENEFVLVCMVSLILGTVALGVYFIVKTCMIWDSFNQLLQEEDYTRKKKYLKRKNKYLSGIYWSLATAIYLGWSFITFQWHITWIVWPIAGVLYGVVENILNWLNERNA